MAGMAVGTAALRLHHGGCELGGNVLQYWSKQKLLHLYYQVLVCTLSAVSKQHEFPHLFDAFHLSFCHTELLPHL